MSSSPHPVFVLNRLLNGRPIPRSLDSYPTHWRALFQALAAVPAHPKLRKPAFQHLLSNLPDSVLAEITENIQDPDSLKKYVSLNPKQHDLITAVSEIGPAAAAEISRYLVQDPSNVHKRLLTLVTTFQTRIRQLRPGWVLP